MLLHAEISYTAAKYSYGNKIKVSELKLLRHVDRMKGKRNGHLKVT